MGGPSASGRLVKGQQRQAVSRVQQKLMIRVLQGYNIRGDDTNGLSDPYAKVKVDDSDTTSVETNKVGYQNNEICTPSVARNNNPSWHKVCPSSVFSAQLPLILTILYVMFCITCQTWHM